MGNAIRFAIWLLSRFIISLRYRVTVHGLEKIRHLKGPVLVLPNHPGMIDPVLILTTFYGVLHPRTVLFEGNFSPPIAAILVRLLRAVPLPDLERPSEAASQRTEQAIEDVISDLHKGENFVLWPSGRAQRDGVERLGAARALTDILRNVPNMDIVLVKTSGVWGSQFSFARTGRMPELGRCLLRGGLLLLSNLLFFMPRRPVEVDVELIDRQELPELKREKINPWFEARYNAGGPEQASYIPYHFLFGPSTYEFPPLAASTEGQFDTEQIGSDTRKAVAEILSAQLGRTLNLDQLDPNTKLEDLGLDSLQSMKAALKVEQQFHVSGDSAPDTIGGLLNLAEGLFSTKHAPPPKGWFRHSPETTPAQILGDSIPEAFVARALSSSQEIAVADSLSGAITYEQLLVGSLLMAQRFRKITADNIGLLLPATVACDTMLHGLYLANKLPVLLNWTTGPANFHHSIKLTQLTHVITSRQLLDRIGFPIEGVQLVFVEDLRRAVNWLEKAYWLVLVRCFPRYIRGIIPRKQPEDRAVILFTSGSEKAPKAVPLTHKNVTSNLRMIPTILELTSQDSVLGFLPMFHSFGFTVTGLFPLLSGIRVIHHSDPTDVAGLTNKIASYRPTVLVGMPSIIGHLVSRGRPDDLASVKWIAVGAEACPASLFELVRKKLPDAALLEGYGVTECSPLISGNRPNAHRTGTIGQPLPGVEVCVADLDTSQPLPTNTVGMLLVSGPGVFSGYLGDEASPFIVLAGKTWYVTGDLAKIEEGGFIRFCGRLKRFIKAGGEMISLPAIEEQFSIRYPAGKDGPQVAVEGIEKDGERQIVLFTTNPLSLQNANAYLTESGFRGVMRLDQVRQLDKIPLLGNGKIDYHKLRSMINDKDLAT